MVKRLRTAFLLAVLFPVLVSVQTSVWVHSGSALASDVTDNDLKANQSAIESEFDRIQHALSLNKISEVRSAVAVVQGRINKSRGALPKDKKKLYKNRIDEINRSMAMKEDSLLNRNLEILGTQGIRAAIDFMERTLRTYGVNEKKFKSIDKAIMDAAPLFQQGPINEPLSSDDAQTAEQIIAGSLGDEQASALYTAPILSPEEPVREVAAKAQENTVMQEPEQVDQYDTDMAPEQALANQSELDWPEVPVENSEPIDEPEPAPPVHQEPEPVARKDSDPPKQAQASTLTNHSQPVAAREPVPPPLIIQGPEPVALKVSDPPKQVQATTLTKHSTPVAAREPLPPPPVRQKPEPVPAKVSDSRKQVPDVSLITTPAPVTAPPVVQKKPGKKVPAAVASEEPIDTRPTSETERSLRRQKERKPAIVKTKAAPPAKKSSEENWKEAEKLAKLREKEIRKSEALRDKIRKQVANEQARVQKRIAAMRQKSGSTATESDQPTPMQIIPVTSEPEMQKPGKLQITSVEDATRMSFTIYNWIIEKRIAKAAETFDEHAKDLKAHMEPEVFAALEKQVQEARANQSTQPRPADSPAAAPSVKPALAAATTPHTEEDRLAARIYQMLSEEKTKKAYDLFAKSKKKLEQSMTRVEYESLKSRVEREYSYLQKLRM